MDRKSEDDNAFRTLICALVDINMVDDRKISAVSSHHNKLLYLAVIWQLSSAVFGSDLAAFECCIWQ